MSYGKKTSGKDTVYFFTKEDISAANPAASSSTLNATPSEEKGAYNPDTGEINWDCPCLGGMARGPCGEQFKASFSCFVFSTAEPKGADCLDAFRSMQNCFQTYPEYYAEQLGPPEEAREQQPVSIVEKQSAPSATQASDLPVQNVSMQPL